MRALRASLATVLAAITGLTAASAQDPGAVHATIRGRVVDAQTGEPLGNVRVAARDTSREVLTDTSGRFVLEGLTPGALRLHVATVGYAVVERPLVLTAGAETVVDIALGPEGIRRAEAVTVEADAFAPVETATSTEYTLSVGELKNLGSVLADDPLRSVHSLPGVAADDDFHATFACRGLGFSAVGFYVDGVLTTAPFHTIRDDEESLGGSITILSGDLVESLSLMSGGAPVRYGDRIGSVLSVRTREGAPQLTTRLNLSIAGGLSATVEGPWAPSGRGRWIVSARKSYLGYVARQVTDDTPLLDYYDVQAKASYRPSDVHRISVFTLYGDFDTQRRDVPTTRPDFQAEAHTRTAFGRLQWEWLLGGKGSFTTTAFATTEAGAQRNRSGADIAHQDSSQAGLRVDLAYPMGAHQRLDAGVLLRQLDEGQQRFTPTDTRVPQIAHEYDVTSTQPGAYVQHTWTTLGHEARADHGVEDGPPRGDRRSRAATSHRSDAQARASHHVRDERQ